MQAGSVRSSPASMPKEARRPRSGPEVESQCTKARCLMTSRAFSQVAAFFFLFFVDFRVGDRRLGVRICRFARSANNLLFD